MEPSVTKRIAKNFSWLLAGNIASGLINFFAIVYIARVLGAAAFGLVQFAQAFLLYLVIVVDSGLSTYGTREIAQDHARAQTISVNIFSLRLLLALAVFCLSVIILFLVPLTPTIRLLFIITFLLVFYRALNADWVFQGLEKMQYVAGSKLLFSALSFTFILLFVRQPADLVNVPLIQFIFGFAIALAILFVLFKRFFSFDLKKVSIASWPQAFMLAVPLGISTIFLQIYDNLDTIMLGIIDTAAVVGIYNAAYRMFYIFAGVFSLWLATVLPVVCKRMHVDVAGTKVFLEKFMRLTMLVAVPITVLVFLSAPLIIKIFFGGEYSRSITALKYLIWALIPLAISSTYGTLVLIPAGFFNLFLVSVGGGALTNAVLNLLLIPRYSFVGAAVATIIAQVVAGVFAFHFSQKVMRLGFVRYLIKPAAISLFASLAFFLAYLVSAGQHQIMQLLAGNIIFFVIAGMLAVYLEHDFIAGFIREIMRK